jgi:protein TonB
MFDRYVADKKRKRPLLYAAFVGSTVLEAGLIIFFIIYSFIHVDEVQPPPLTVQFVNSAPPPPPPPPPPKAANKPKTPPKVPKPVMQPNEVPKFIQPKTAPEPPEEKDTGNAEGGMEGGVEGGVAGGVVTGAPPPPPKEEPKPPPKPKVVPAILIKKDKISSGDDPHLPDVVKAQRRGSVVSGSYKVCIGQTGSISSVDVMQGIPGADDTIISTVRQWRYKPQAIPICFIQYFEFHIE